MSIAAPETTTLAPGVHHGVAFDDYCRVDAINASTLKLFAEPPAKARHKMLHPDDPTEALNVGEATHKAILEPAAFERDYAAAPRIDRRYKEGKAAWERFKTENADKIVLTAEEYEQASAMAAAARQHALARELLLGKGANEVTLIWRDMDDELCKARIDRLAIHRGWPVIVDIKTTRDASPDGFAREIVSFGYHVQAAHYMAGIRAIKPADYRWLFIAIEKEPPHLAAVYEMEDRALREGMARRDAYMSTLIECRKTGLWPGYGATIQTIGLPNWSYRFTTE